MNDFQEQAKNWLRNVVKQNPGKIKAGVEKAGDVIDKQTGGKYAEKVDAVQQKVGNYVDSQSTETGSAASTSSGPEAETGPDDGAPDAASQAGSSSQAGAEPGEAGAGVAASDGGSEAGAGVVGGKAPDPAAEPSSSAGSRPEGIQTGGTVTGRSEAPRE